MKVRRLSRRMNARGIAASGFEQHAIGEPRDDIERARARVRRLERPRRPHCRIVRVIDVRRHHTDDRDDTTIVAQWPAEHRGVASESPLPERVRDETDAGIGADTFLVGRERAAQDRVEAQRLRPARRYADRADALGRSVADERDAPATHGDDTGEAPALRPDDLEVARRQVVAARLAARRRVRVADPDETVAVTERQRALVDRVDDVGQCRRAAEP